VVFPMPIDIIKPFLNLLEQPAKPRGLNGDARAARGRSRARRPRSLSTADGTHASGLVVA